jgi:hypothetical protein
MRASAPLSVLIRQMDPREHIRAIPHYIDRIAAGVLDVRPGVLSTEDEAAIAARRDRIRALREQRRRRREPPPPRTSCTTVVWRGIRLRATWVYVPGRRTGIMWRVDSPDGHRGISRREAVALTLKYRVRRYGRYTLQYVPQGYWDLRVANGRSVAHWRVRPGRAKIAAAIREHRRMTRAAVIDTAADSTLGWRAWHWDGATLRSPHLATRWPSSGLTAHEWSDHAAVRGVAGIHARRMPRDWLHAGWPNRGPYEGASYERNGIPIVTGVVERIGRYVLGTTGWRAESVIIRELCAPSVEVMLALMQRYPDVRVHLSPYATTTIGEPT